MARGISLEDLGKMYGVERKEKVSQQKNFLTNKFQQKNFQQNNAPQKNSLATAPYNFVALPEKILLSPISDVETY